MKSIVNKLNHAQAENKYLINLITSMYNGDCPRISEIDACKFGEYIFSTAKQVLPSDNLEMNITLRNIKLIASQKKIKSAKHLKDYLLNEDSALLKKIHELSLDEQKNTTGGRISTFANLFIRKNHNNNVMSLL